MNALHPKGQQPQAQGPLPRGFETLPQGLKDPNSKVLGPKYFNINGIWAPKLHCLGPKYPYIVPMYPYTSPRIPLKGPYYLGPWTLRVEPLSRLDYEGIDRMYRKTIIGGHVSYSLNSLNWCFLGDYIGEYYWGS